MKISKILFYLVVLTISCSALRAQSNERRIASVASGFIEFASLTQSEKGVSTFASQSIPLGVELQRRTTYSRSFADTARRESYIKSFSNVNNTELRLWMNMAEEQTVDIGVFNILGKKIKDLDSRTIIEGEMLEPLKYSIGDIPNGVYIVAAQGSSFRSAIRIVISR